MDELILFFGTDVRLDEIVLRAMDKADRQEVAECLQVTNNVPGVQTTATTIA